MKQLRVHVDEETYRLLKAAVDAENTCVMHWLRSRIEVAVRTRPAIEREVPFQ